MSLVAVDLEQVPERVRICKKKQFSVESPSASRPSFEAALVKSFRNSGARRSGRDCREAPVFQGRYK